jgi:integrase
MKNYKSARIYRGKQWHVEYLYKNPSTGKFDRFKVYEEINRIPLEERDAYAEKLRQSVNMGLKEGFSPFEERVELEVKNWTLLQGLNLFKQNLPDRGLRKRTVQTYGSVIKMLLEFTSPIKHDLIKDVTKQQIQSVLNNAKKKNEWSNTTFNNNLTFVKAIFNYLIDQEILQINPAERIKPLPQQITKHKYFDDKTFNKIKKEADPELLSFIMFLYHTGTRPNEARQLTDKNILRDRKLLFIPASISKNKKDDYVPLTDWVLKNYQPFKQPVNYYGQRFAELKKKLGLDSNYTLYSIKHTRAIHLAQDKADPYTIMQLFRHSGLDITMAYLKDLGVNINREATEKGIRF